jgi:hypothetical protein
MALFHDDDALMQQDDNELHRNSIVNHLSTVVNHRLKWLHNPNPASLIFISELRLSDPIFECHLALDLRLTLQYDFIEARLRRLGQF